jgi:hypothetical protein
VVIDSEPALSGQPFFQLCQIVPGEVNDFTAAGAYQVVMVLGYTERVAGVVYAGVKLADKVKGCQDFQGTVDGHQADAGVILVNPVVYIGGRKVVVAIGDSVDNGTTLWSRFVAVPSQGSNNSLLGKLHLRC